MRNNTSLIIIAAILLAVFLCVLVGIGILLPTSTKTLPAEAQVDDIVGINLDPDKMYFGTVQPGGASRRWINVESEDDAFVVISVDGELQSWLKPDANRFLVEGSEERSVLFILRVPEDARKATMTGTVVVRTYRPAARWLLGQGS